MKVIVIGAGAAGLSTAIAAKRQLKADVRILEKASEADDPGLGVALLAFGLDHLRVLGPEAFPALTEDCPRIARFTRVFAGDYPPGVLIRQSRVQDMEYWGVKRSAILSFLKNAARRAGVEVEYNANVTEAEIARLRNGSDLLVGADGAGSVVRSAFARDFGPKGQDAESRYAWLELEGAMDHFLFGYMFVSGLGLVRITAYPHTRRESSVIITHSAGLTGRFDEPGMTDPDGAISAAGLAFLNDVFGPALEGRKLSGGSRWRRFRSTHCQRAAFSNVALVGDAFATMHYETGWGTSKALQESRLLIKCLAGARTVEGGLVAYNSENIAASRSLLKATVSTMRDLDGQAATFAAKGAAKFLERTSA